MKNPLQKSPLKKGSKSSASLLQNFVRREPTQQDEISTSSVDEKDVLICDEVSAEASDSKMLDKVFSENTEGTENETGTAENDTEKTENVTVVTNDGIEVTEKSEDKTSVTEKSEDKTSVTEKSEDKTSVTEKSEDKTSVKVNARASDADKLGESKMNEKDIIEVIEEAESESEKSISTKEVEEAPKKVSKDSNDAASTEVRKKRKRLSIGTPTSKKTIHDKVAKKPKTQGSGKKVAKGLITAFVKKGVAAIDHTKKITTAKKSQDIKNSDVKSLETLNASESSEKDLSVDEAKVSSRNTPGKGSKETITLDESGESSNISAKSGESSHISAKSGESSNISAKSGESSHISAKSGESSHNISAKSGTSGDSSSLSNGSMDGAKLTPKMLKKEEERRRKQEEKLRLKKEKEEEKLKREEEKMRLKKEKEEEQKRIKEAKERKKLEELE